MPNVIPGQWLQIAPGHDNANTLLTTGAPLGLATAWIKESGTFWGYALHSLPLWGMSTKASQSCQVKRYQCVTTLEDHLYDGGFGSWMRESLENNPALMTRIKVRALDSIVCGMVGGQNTLNQLGGLCYWPMT